MLYPYISDIPVKQHFRIRWLLIFLHAMLYRVLLISPLDNTLESNSCLSPYTLKLFQKLNHYSDYKCLNDCFVFDVSWLSCCLYKQRESWIFIKIIYLCCHKDHNQNYETFIFEKLFLRIFSQQILRKKNEFLISDN